jgi:hypothetical protein
LDTLSREQGVKKAHIAPNWRDMGLRRFDAQCESIIKKQPLVTPRDIGAAIAP